jgi:exopolyphosphatase/guanosine-5'-triphosphate,3'-diphosphate pyrophosphatase
MTSLAVELGTTTTTFALDAAGHALGADGALVIPCGVASMSAWLSADPAPPEDLTNAIGEMVDHLDDVLRELPAAADAAEVTLRGEHAWAIAAVEAGAEPAAACFELSRDAAEDVFRTVATERRAERAHNPGLPAELVDDIVGACCAVVAIMRTLQLERVAVIRHPREPNP